MQIKENTLIFSCELANKSDHIVLNKVDADTLKQTQIQLTQYDYFQALDKLTTVVSKFMCCYAKIDHKPPVAKMSDCDTFYTASEGLLNLANKADVGDKLHPCLKTGSSLFNFATQANNITKLLLGQQLLQNNSVFSKEMIMQAPGECNKLSEIISDLKSQNPRNCKNFVLRNDI